jgi:hypothetical protein
MYALLILCRCLRITSVQGRRSATVEGAIDAQAVNATGSEKNRYKEDGYADPEVLVHILLVIIHHVQHLVRVDDII